jgi:hypothetical protein
MYNKLDFFHLIEACSLKYIESTKLEYTFSACCMCEEVLGRHFHYDPHGSSEFYE